MKKVWIGALIFLVFIFIYFGWRAQRDIMVPNTVPMDIRALTLPPTFTMVVKGDFTDPTIIPSKYRGYASSAFLMSSGGEELQGEVQYTYASPGTNGNLILCEIKDGKWITNTTMSKECNALTKLATTRIELTRQITSGELIPLKSGMCTGDQLCYELK